MIESDADQDIGRAMRRRGALVTSTFALVWAMAGSSGLADPVWRVVVLVVAVVATVATVLLAFRIGPAGPDRPRRLPANWQHRFNRVGIAQAVAIGLTVVIFVASGNPMLIPSAVCLIVGIHFFPLVRIFDQPQYRRTGAGLCAVAAAGFVTFAFVDGETSLAMVGLGAAITLWGTSLHVTRHG